jgi:hypothetical protein
MQIVESFGDPCRYCGSTQVIAVPTQFAGACGRCSRDGLVERRWAMRVAQAAQGSAIAPPQPANWNFDDPARSSPSGPKRFGRLPPRARGQQTAPVVRNPADAQLTLPGL